MLIYNNRQEMIDELASNLRVEYRPYGTWRISSYVGSKWNKEDGYIEEYYDSNNEEDSIGIFDGEKYNPQNFDDWYFQVFSYELPEDDEPEYYNDEELQEKFKEYCEKVWSDSGNEDNYEPIEERLNRLAEIIFDLINDGDTTNLFFGGDEESCKIHEPRYAVTSNEESNFIFENDNILDMSYEGKFEEIVELFKKHQEEF